MYASSLAEPIPIHHPVKGQDTSACQADHYKEDEAVSTHLAQRLEVFDALLLQEGHHHMQPDDAGRKGRCWGAILQTQKTCQLIINYCPCLIYPDLLCYNVIVCIIPYTENQARAHAEVICEDDQLDGPF